MLSPKRPYWVCLNPCYNGIKMKEKETRKANAEAES